MRWNARLVGLALWAAAAVLSALAAALPETVAAAAGRPPVIEGVQLPPAAPQGYWICVRRNPDGTCRVQKTCIRWQGGECTAWVFVDNNTGHYFCLGRVSTDCSWFFRTSGGGRTPVEEMAEELGRPRGRGAPRAYEALRPGAAPGGYRAVVVEGFVEFADGRRPDVRLLFVSGESGGVILVHAFASGCGPLEREALEMVLAWASGSGGTQALRRPGGCAVTVSPRGLNDWLRRLEHEADRGGNDGPGHDGAVR